MSVKDKVNQIFDRGAVFQTGYDYLCEPQNGARAKSFADAFESAVFAQGIPVADNQEFKALAIEALDRIATQSSLNKVDPRLVTKKLPGMSV